jgi:hypothetical protein
MTWISLRKERLAARKEAAAKGSPGESSPSASDTKNVNRAKELQANK